MRICRKCNEQRLDIHDYCWDCGSKLEETLRNPCPSCKREIAHTGHKYCYWCGAELEAGQ
jgi:predicted amidophosphoribosyltransferase